MKKIILSLAIGSMLGGPVSAQATEFKDFVGTWQLKIDHQSFFVVELDGSSPNPHGVFWRPKGLAVTNNVFQVNDPHADRFVLVQSEIKGDELRLTFRDDSKDEMKFFMRRQDGKVELGIPDVPAEAGLGPWALEKVAPGTSISEAWQPGRAYMVGDDDAPNLEMGRIYAQDQAERTKQPLDLNKLAVSDAARRARTKELVDKGLLHTGLDYKQAAFVLQHGDTPNDYLMAHSLAIVAISKGEPTAVWIASASLDRYLWSKNLPQVYGTQSSTSKDGKSTTEPYDRSALPQSLKTQLGVPSTK